MTDLRLGEHEKLEAIRLRQYFPYRRVWLVAEKEGDRYLICKVDARYANRLLRAGHRVSEVLFNPVLKD